LVADVEQRVGVAVGPGMEATHRSRTRTLLGSGPRPGAEKAGALRTEREGATEVRVAVGVVVPRRDRAGGVQSRRDENRHRRGRRFELVFVGSRPLHLYGAA